MQPINRLVEELTGINLDLITKEQLTKETVDKSVSPRTITPLPVRLLFIMIHIKYNNIHRLYKYFRP